MAKILKKGYGQVEPNHLSAQRTAQIYAQLPIAETVKQLEQGQFATYNYKDNVVDFSGDGEWMLVYSEVKTYGSRETDADFVNTSNGPCPRLFKTNVGDIFTTNTIKGADSEEGVTVEVGNMLKINTTDGYLTVAEDGEWQVVKTYTLADGQSAVKIMKIK